MIIECDDEPPDAFCEDCGDPMDASEINVEAFEMTGHVLCEDCAQEAFEKAARQ